MKKHKMPTTTLDISWHIKIYTGRLLVMPKVSLDYLLKSPINSNDIWSRIGYNSSKRLFFYCCAKYSKIINYAVYAELVVYSVNRTSG